MYATIKRASYGEEACREAEKVGLCRCSAESAAVSLRGLKRCVLSNGASSLAVYRLQRCVLLVCSLHLLPTCTSTEL